VGAIHVHGPAYRFPAPGEAENTGQLLLEAAQRLAGLITSL
jgi:DNA-binding IclR family transcriptional regulator